MKSLPLPREVVFMPARIRQIAEAALKEPGGLIVNFYIDRYPNEESCHRAARLLQQNFSSLRAKTRATEYAALKIGYPNMDMSDFRAYYDDLGAYMEKFDGGWRIRFIKVENALDGMEIVNAQGEPVKLKGN